MNNRSWDSNDAGHQPAQPPPGQAGPPPWAGPQPQWNPYGQQWAPAPPRKRNTVLIAVLATAAGVVLAGVTVALIMSPDTPSRPPQPGTAPGISSNPTGPKTRVITVQVLPTDQR